MERDYLQKEKMVIKQVSRSLKVALLTSGAQAKAAIIKDEET